MSIAENSSSQQSNSDLYNKWKQTTEYNDTQLKILSQLTVILQGAWLDIYNQAIKIHKDRPQAAHYIALNIMCLAAQGYLRTPSLNYNIGVGLSESGKTWPNNSIMQTIDLIKSGVYRISMPGSGGGLNTAFLAHPKPNCIYWKDEGLSDVYGAISPKSQLAHELSIYNKLLSIYGFLDRLEESKNKLEENSTKPVLFPKLTFNIDAQDNIFKKCLDSRAVLEKGFIQRAFIWHFKRPRKIDNNRMESSRHNKQSQDNLAIKDLSELHKLTSNFIDTTDITQLVIPPSDGEKFPNYSDIQECNWEKHYNEFLHSIKDNPNLIRALSSTERMEGKIRFYAQIHAWGRQSKDVQTDDMTVGGLLASLHYANFRDIYINSFYTDNEVLLFKLLGQKLIKSSENGGQGVTLANLQVSTARFAAKKEDPYLKSRFMVTIRSILDSGYAIKIPNSAIDRRANGYTLKITESGIAFFNSNLDSDLY